MGLLLLFILALNVANIIFFHVIFKIVKDNMKIESKNEGSVLENDL